MVATWQIKNTGEILTVVVTKNFDAFRKLIDNHKQMKFIKWSNT